MVWSDERVKILIKMWKEGHSASKIAEHFGEGLTRNAVIGKIHRLNAARRTPLKKDGNKARKASSADSPAAQSGKKSAKAANGSQPKDKASKAKGATTQQEDAPGQEGAPASDAAPNGDGALKAGRANGADVKAKTAAQKPSKKPAPKNISLLELTERTCKWPIGDPATDNFGFCGLPAQAEKPYCETHVALAFQPFNGRKDRRRG